MKNITPRQYKPFNHRIGDIPLIIYPIVGLHTLVANKTALTQHLDALYQKQDETIGRGRFHIVFVWEWHGLVMTDIWIQQINTLSPDVGGEIGIEKCVTFKGYEQYIPVGIASDNTAVVIGREQEHRWKFDSLDKYLDRSKSMPDFPESFAPVEEF